MKLSAKDLSIVIPVGIGDGSYQVLLSDLEKLDFENEIILSSHRVLNLSHYSLKKLSQVQSESGRAKQLNRGAEKATHKVLLFLHADSRLKPHAFDKLLSHFDCQALNFFDLKFDSENILMRLNEWGVLFRSNILKIPFGDQGFCLTQELFLRLGKFDELAPFGEDHLFVWKTRMNEIRLNRIPAILYTSARKYEKGGWGKTTLSHLYWTVRQSIQGSRESRK